jgi:hypothetical protein
MLSSVVGHNGHVVIRLGGKGLDPEQLVSALSAAAKVAPRRVRMIEHSVSEITRRQTDAFRPGTTGCRHEVDAVFVIK